LIIYVLEREIFSHEMMMVRWEKTKRTFWGKTQNTPKVKTAWNCPSFLSTRP